MASRTISKIRPESAAAADPFSDLNMALNEQRCVLYQVLRIIGLASEHLQETDPDPEVAWGALDGAQTLLNGVIDKIESKETLLDREVAHG